MCCEGKCLMFLPLQRGTLIFGYISAIISGLGTILFTGLAMHSIIGQFANGYNLSNHHELLQTITAVQHNLSSGFLSTAFLIECLSGFICSVLLLVGIKQNKPLLVKTYFIYGMVQVVLLLTFFIMLHCEKDFFTFVGLLVAVAVLGIYSLLLYMVLVTYNTEY